MYGFVDPDGVVKAFKITFAWNGLKQNQDKMSGYFDTSILNGAVDDIFDN